jgi:hypothetical protein
MSELNPTSEYYVFNSIVRQTEVVYSTFFKTAEHRNYHNGAFHIQSTAFLYSVNSTYSQSNYYGPVGLFENIKTRVLIHFFNGIQNVGNTHQTFFSTSFGSIDCINDINNTVASHHAIIYAESSVVNISNGVFLIKNQALSQHGTVTFIKCVIDASPGTPTLIDCKIGAINIELLNFNSNPCEISTLIFSPRVVLIHVVKLVSYAISICVIDSTF